MIRVYVQWQISPRQRLIAFWQKYEGANTYEEGQYTPLEQREYTYSRTPYCKQKLQG